MAERWLLTGGTGQLGRALSRMVPDDVELVAPTRRDLDLARFPDISPLLEGVSAIINCAGYTAVDLAESEPERAMELNAVAPAMLARAAAAADIPLVHISTDYVFPVRGQGPWSENHWPDPGNTYGRSKLAGENAVRASGARHAIIRTAWLVSADGSNFLKTMLRLGGERNILRVVADQLGTPTNAEDLAQALVEVVKSFTENPQRRSGTWHCANAGKATWHEIACEVSRQAEALGLKVPELVEPISSVEYPMRAIRPSDSRLDCARVKAEFGLALRPWQHAVREILTELACEKVPA